MTQLELYWGTDDATEDIHRYTPGGLHPTRLGDVLTSHSGIPGAESRRYCILHKLGHGAFATVWLATALDSTRPCYVAIKICAADAEARPECEIFKRFPQDEARNVVRLLDNFALKGPNGTHTVLVFNVLGSLMEVLRSPEGYKQAKEICRQVVQGVAALHRHGIVHGDLHVGNVGVTLPALQSHSVRDLLDYFGHPECTIVHPIQPPSRPEALPPYLIQPISLMDFISDQDPSFPEKPLQIVIMDLGEAFVEEEQSRPTETPAAFCAPEIMFGQVAQSSRPASTRSSEIWSLACSMYEIVFRGTLFYFAAPNYALLGNMATVCGEIPSSWKSYWDGNERLREMPISKEIADAQWRERENAYKTGRMHANSVPREDIDQFVDLLRSMLKMDPQQRPSAEEVLRHPWFASGRRQASIMIYDITPYDS